MHRSLHEATTPKTRKPKQVRKAEQVRQCQKKQGRRTSKENALESNICLSCRHKAVGKVYTINFKDDLSGYIMTLLTANPCAPNPFTANRYTLIGGGNGGGGQRAAGGGGGGGVCDGVVVWLVVVVVVAVAMVVAGGAVSGGEGGGGRVPRASKTP